MEPRISLIITTIGGRKHLLERCLASIEEQSYRNFEAIIVDQADSAETRNLVEHYAWARYVAARPVGLSACRNQGIALARGQLIVFPDDDSTLAPNMLDGVDQVFRSYPELGILSVAVVDPHTGRRIARFPGESTVLTVWNMVRRHCSASLVVHRRVLDTRHDVFDPRLGVGTTTPFAASEETDLVLRLLLSGVQGRYEPAIVVYHPNTSLSEMPLFKIEAYGRGYGACFRKAREHFGWWPVGLVWTWIMLRGYVGIVIDSLRGDFRTARLRMRSLAARWDGWRQYKQWDRTTAPAGPVSVEP